jgi:16S rRNA processing protein RimM
VRSHGKRLLIRLDGVDEPDAAAAFAGATLWAPRQDVELAAGEFLDADLVACEVVGVDGVTYGSVERVEHYPASDMLVVNGHFVPMVSAIVRDIDLNARRIVIDPPQGLLD